MTTPDPPPAPDEPDAHEVVPRLRQKLRRLGLPEDVIRQVVPTSDMERRRLVRLGTWSVQHAAMLADLLPDEVPAAAGRTAP